jgi:hypothetical protein
MANLQMDKPGKSSQPQPARFFPRRVTPPTRRSFLKCAGLAGLALSSRRLLVAADESPQPLGEFGYGDVDLAPGAAQAQFEHTQAVLLSLNEDSLLKPWRRRAGLPAPGPDLGGWYDEVDHPVATASGGHGYAPGHCFGQWISALARGYAVSRDSRVRAKLERLLALYAPAISGRFYRDFRYPAYNYDKLVGGLVDAHRWAGQAGALALLDRTTDAAEPHLPPRALDRAEPQRRWRLAVGGTATKEYTRDESYTLPENLYLAAAHGAGARYRDLAGRFLLDETFFDPLSAGRDALAHHHAYSYFNALNSAMQAYLSTGSRKHFEAARHGYERVVTTQSYATGGWGPNEGFSAPGSGALYASLAGTHRSFETPCGSYAHFKLARYLLRVTGDGQYGDSLERVLYNTVLGAKRLEPDGHAFYYSDYHGSGRKTYFPDAWPCCSGTLPQVAADYRLLGYFHDAAGVFVNLYLPSAVRWTSADGAQLTLSQEGDYPLEGSIRLRTTLSRPARFSVRLRIPAWSLAGTGPAIRVNGRAVSAPIGDGFATVRRDWRDGDEIALDLPLPVRLEPIDPDHPACVAVVRGPLVLFALTESAPRLERGRLAAPERIPGQAAWTVETADGPLRLVPFTEIGEDPYLTYLTVG